jgi:hypothetical protein
MIINAGYGDDGKIRRLRLAPEDIEEAVARCGWTCLNNAEDINDADRVALRRLRLQGHATMTTESGADALKWWNDRLITA